MSYRVIPFSRAHAARLAPQLSAADVAELRAAGAKTSYQALLAGIKRGPSWVALDDGEPVGAFGYTRKGVVWSLWASLNARQARAVLKHTREWVARMVSESGRPYLVNAVMREHRGAIRWLARSGCFDIMDDGGPWIPFTTKPEFAHVQC